LLLLLLKVDIVFDFWLFGVFGVSLSTCQGRLCVQLVLKYAVLSLQRRTDNLSELRFLKRLLEGLCGSDVYTIAIAIAAVGATRAYMARLAIFGAQTLFRICLGHDNINFVLYGFMC